VVEPDADSDGFGDITQDRCPGQAGSADGCPSTGASPPTGGAPPTPSPRSGGAPVTQHRASVVLPRKVNAASLAKGVRTSLSGLRGRSKVTVRLRAGSKALATVKGRASRAGNAKLTLKLPAKRATKLRHKRLTVRYSVTVAGGAAQLLIKTLKVT
jgi:hypothetical protein